MPISSHQISGMIGGQQAMFGNFASYAQQISPGGPSGPTPTYSNPMAGVDMAPTNPSESAAGDFGVRGLSAIGNIGIPAIASAAMIGGSFLPGAMGKFMGGLDPMSQGLSGFARGAGLRAGGQGIMANLGRIASGGIGSVARAGISGLGGAAMAAAAPLAIGAGVSYGVGQMVQGAQFQQQGMNFLDRNFRQTNSQSETGFGFGREGGGQIMDVVRQMGNKEMMSSPQEMLRLMQAGTGMGVFKAVQDAKQFQAKFKEMVGALKEVASTMHTTLEGAVPFLQESKKMGFWTPQDISRNAQMTRQTAGATGMSVAQTQQMMSQGAGMARQIGANGWTGAEGMAQSLQLVGGAQRSGFLSPQRLSELTGGLTGAEATQSFAGTMQASATRFAAGNTGRWMMAALGGKNFESLDQGALNRLKQGDMGFGEIGGRARRNIGKQGAFNFVMNEEELRGELVRQGPEVQFGAARALAGGALYGTGARDKHVTRRVMQRFFGVGGKQADAYAQLAREMPNIMRDNEARGAESADADVRQRDEVMNRSFEGVKRQAAKWWDSNVKEPLQSFGAEQARSISRYYDKMTDKFWGSTPARHRLRGITSEGMGALQKAALGDTREMETFYGKPGDMERRFGGAGSGLGLTSGGVGGFMESARALGGLGNALTEGGMTNRRIEGLRRMGVGEIGFDTEEQRRRAGREQGVVSGATRAVVGDLGKGQFRGMLGSDIQEALQGLHAAQTGQVSARGAAALGFQSEKQAKDSIKAIQSSMSDSTFRDAQSTLAIRTRASGRELAEKMVTAIERKEMGDDNLRKYLAGAKSMQQKVHRLGAAQTAERRGQVGGINLAEDVEAQGAGAGFGGIHKTEAEIGKAMEGAEAKLSEALSMGATTAGDVYNQMSKPWRTLKVRKAVDVKTIEKLRTKREFRELTMEMASTPSTTEGIKAKNDRIRKLGAQLKGDPDMSKEEQEVLVRMTDPNDPGYKEAQAALETLGGLEKDKNVAAFQETVLQRRKRMLSSMGPEKEVILSSLDKVSGGGENIGSLARELIENTAAHPEQYVNKIKELVTASGQADPAKMAHVMEQIKRLPGGEDIATAMAGGVATRELTERSTQGKLKDPRKAAGAFHMATGLTIDPKDMARLVGSKEADANEVKSRILKDIPEGEKKNVEGMLTAMREKDPTSLRKHISDRAAERAIHQLSDPAKGILNEAAAKLRLDPGTMQAGMGSPKGMHLVLVAQLNALNGIKDAIDNVNTGTAPEGPKPKKGP